MIGFAFWTSSLLANLPPPSLGEAAPQFEVVDHLGTTHRLVDFRGKYVVLAFFPKDFSPRCTAQVRSFRDNISSLKLKNTVVLGVSSDPIETRVRFAQAEKLNFPLVVDPNNDLAKKLGVSVQNGRPHRTSIIIGPDGHIIGVDSEVDLQFKDSTDGLTTTHTDSLELFLSSWSARVGDHIPPLWLLGPDKAVVSTLAPNRISVLLVAPVVPGVSDQLSTTIQNLKKTPGLSGVKWTWLQVDSQAPKVVNGWQDGIGVDVTGLIASRLNMHRTPSVVVLDETSTVIYRGLISIDPTGGDPVLLRQALIEHLKGRRVSVPEYWGGRSN